MKNDIRKRVQACTPHPNPLLGKERESTPPQPSPQAEREKEFEPCGGDTVTLEAVYPRPIERVWHALTSQEQLGRWLMPTDFETVLGREFRFQRRRGSLPTAPTANPSLKGRESALDWDDAAHDRNYIRCAVLAVDRPYRLEYSWESDDTPLSVVTWTLTAVDDGQTAVRLEHRKIGPRAHVGLSAGWSSAIYRRLPAFLHLPHRGVKLIRSAPGRFRAGQPASRPESGRPLSSRRMA
jgi:uncharacterized protein YndB with AHSA1/START domain